MTPTRRELMDRGYSWEEAEDLLEQYAEEERDAERDREMEERLNQGESK